MAYLLFHRNIKVHRYLLRTSYTDFGAIGKNTSKLHEPHFWNLLWHIQKKSDRYDACWSKQNAVILYVSMVIRRQNIWSHPKMIRCRLTDMNFSTHNANRKHGLEIFNIHVASSLCRTLEVFIAFRRYKFWYHEN